MICGHLRVAVSGFTGSLVAVRDRFAGMGVRPLNGNEAQHG